MTSRGIDMIPKFRAWVKKEKRMYVVLAIDFHFNHDITVSRGQSSGDVFQIPLKEVILIQFIGLKDKRKKEIYNGDIIKYSDGKNFKIERKDAGFYTVPIKRPDPIFNQPFIIPRICKLVAEKSEVIGNIYSNPELLKEGEWK